MLPESHYIKNLRLSLSKSKALTWLCPTSNNKNIKVTTPPKITYSYRELTEILDEDSITDVNQMVRKNIINDTYTQLLYFVIKGLGLLVYTFENGTTVQMWFIPERYLQFQEMKKAINRLNKSILEFTETSVIHIYISRLQLVADQIDQNNQMVTKHKAMSYLI